MSERQREELQVKSGKSRAKAVFRYRELEHAESNVKVGNVKLNVEMG